MRLKLFFKSKSYRKMWGKRLKRKIMSPMNFIQAIWKTLCETVKSHKENPSGWERYVRSKESENKIKEAKKREDIVISIGNLLGASTRLELFLFKYCYYSKEMPQQNLEEINEAVLQVKQEIKDEMDKLERNEVTVPDKLKAELCKISLDQFGEMEECEEYFEKVHHQIMELNKN